MLLRHLLVPHIREALSSMFSPQLRTGFPLLPWGREQRWLRGFSTRGSPVNVVARDSSPQGSFVSFCLLYDVFTAITFAFFWKHWFFNLSFVFTGLKCSFCTCFSESWEIMLSVLTQWTCLSVAWGHLRKVVYYIWLVILSLWSLSLPLSIVWREQGLCDFPLGNE